MREQLEEKIKYLESIKLSEYGKGKLTAFRECLEMILKQN